MNKKGFTLIELLGVIVILGILALIVFPPIINQIRNIRDQTSAGTLKLLYTATKKYMNENKDNYPLKEDSTYCVSLQTLVDNGKAEAPITDAQTGLDMPLTKQIFVDVISSSNITYSLVDACDYIDPSGAKAPVLTSEMIPITWDGTKWVKADLKTAWYSYNDKKWANAILVNEVSRMYYQDAAAGTLIDDNAVLMYLVWVPRFRYQIFNASFSSIPVQTINIIFEGKRATRSNGTLNGDWLTHPAFTFGTTQVNGLWVAKFEAGYMDATTAAQAQITTPEVNKLISKPSTYSWRNISISNIHTVATQLTTSGNMYGLENTTTDTHVMRNSEWGATAYLAQSIYGKNAEVWINPNFNYLTGCAGASVSAASSSTCNIYSSALGINASTTGNVYGIYDTSGGALEATMGVQYNSGTNTNLAVQLSGFLQATLDAEPMSKYVDKYIYGTTFNDQTAFNRSQLGDANGEVRGWYGDQAQIIYNVSAWTLRGGTHNSGLLSGIFYGNSQTGAGNTNSGFRPAIANLN